ncbi:hypothetical protein DYT03_15790 [Salmonella enterica]|nr:hypothetical protein [Salmonella enterica subsp. enterica]EAO9717126.1 hypothetical protein [Salmonella enterica]ECT8306942.1 hypothetical protein [Salmonella enterica subsp. enterica serovar Llandoff]EGZ4607849.1 hypothetical protein [Salmonella enterica subsp. enterica serovar Everleigh]EBI6345345.1 hypothetical protein [Salmonella enterica]
MNVRNENIKYVLFNSKTGQMEPVDVLCSNPSCTVFSVPPGAIAVGEKIVITPENPVKYGDNVNEKNNSPYMLIIVVIVFAVALIAKILSKNHS